MSWSALNPSVEQIKDDYQRTRFCPHCGRGHMREEEYQRELTEAHARETAKRMIDAFKGKFDESSTSNSR